VVFSGHEHNFQFSELLEGIRYVVSGAGGELRDSDVRASMVDAHIEGWAAQYHFLVVEIDKKEMRITPRSFETVTVVDHSGRRINMPLRVTLP
jgi:hypothetical protein